MKLRVRRVMLLGRRSRAKEETARVMMEAVKYGDFELFFLNCLRVFI